MLISFFLKRLSIRFFLFFVLMLLILATSDLFVRIPVIPSVYMIPHLVLAMLPLVALFAVPLASCLAVQMVIGDLCIDDNLLLLNFFASARASLYKSVLLFSLLIQLFFIPLIFFWAPQSYEIGKRMLISFARDHLLQLEPHIFHTPLEGVTIYFEDKTQIDHGVQAFHHLLLVMTTKHKEQYFFSAKQGQLHKDHLLMNHGSMLMKSGKRSYSACFLQSKIDLDQLVDYEKKNSGLKDQKFSTLPKLVHHALSQKEAAFEIHKRIAQIIWQLLLPFLALFSIFLWRHRRKSGTLLPGILMSGSLFFAQYSMLTLAQAVSKYDILSKGILYAPALTLLFMLYLQYKKIL
jgi:lipopolysaccharide export LptBFGC system permease protein LptF